jgi:hypothetical protein
MTILVIVALVAASGSGAAAENPVIQKKARKQAASETVTALRTFLASLWSAAQEIGCKIDPLGSPCTPVTKPSEDIGCKIDPLGGCRP